MKVLGLVEISSRVWKMAHVKKKLEEHIFLYIPTYTVLFFFFLWPYQEETSENSYVVKNMSLSPTHWCNLPSRIGGSCI